MNNILCRRSSIPFLSLSGPASSERYAIDATVTHAQVYWPEYGRVCYVITYVLEKGGRRRKRTYR